MYGHPLLSHNYSFCALVCVRVRVRPGSLLICLPQRESMHFHYARLTGKRLTFLLVGISPATQGHWLLICQLSESGAETAVGHALERRRLAGWLAEESRAEDGHGLI